jgi:hypothetical protein
MVQPWQAPVPVVGPGGKASPEWLRWLQQLLAAGKAIDANGADITQLRSLLATVQTAVTAIEAEIATLEPLTLETNYARNGSQTQLNLVAGTNITLSDNGAGDVTISAAPGGSSGSTVEETPAGALDGENISFTLSHSPNPSASLALYLNGVEQRAGVDYALSGTTISYAVAPKSDDTMNAYYSY